MKAHLRALLTVMLALAWSGSAAAQTANCSRDTLTIDGTPVDVTLCVPPPETGRKGKGEGRPVSIQVSETFSAGGTSFTRSTALDFLERRETSRTIDDVPLQKLGISKSLHLTIGYRAGSVLLEHALLIPGAVPLK